MISNLGHKIRRLERKIEESATDAKRFVDMGVLLRVVVADDENGQELLPDKPGIKLRVVREHRFGGVIDTHANPVRIVAASTDPVVWYCSEDQETALLHNVKVIVPGKPGQLVIGSEGAGKSTLLAMWHFIHGVLRHLGQRREGGQTAPTEERSEAFIDAAQKLYRPTWFRWFAFKKVFRFVDGPKGRGSRIRVRTTKKQSQAAGSPIQSYNWSWAGRDESQDQVEVHEDIHARLRTAQGGLAGAPQLITATQKNDSNWRTLREVIAKCGYFVVHVMDGRNSPFIPKEHWIAMAGTISAREFARRVGVQDLGPEHRQYPEWETEGRPNLIAIPEDWADVTEQVFRIKNKTGNRYALLGGHDPGNMWDVSLLLKAYRPPEKQWRNSWVWIVVDEITTEESTTEQHVAALLPKIQQRKCNLRDARGRPNTLYPSVHFRCDPYTATGSETRPSKDTLTVFRSNGIEIHPAAYKPGTTNPAQVPKNEGIQMVRSLLCNQLGERRLYVARDKQGKPVAPMLVKCLEESQLDERGRAETAKKNKQDLSHWGAALRYALWWVEKPVVHKPGALTVVSGGLS